MLRKLVEPGFSVHVCWLGSELGGFVVLDGEYAMPHADPKQLDVRELIHWAEDHGRATNLGSLEVSVWDDDADLLGAMKASGYTPSGTFGSELFWRLEEEPPRATLPSGYAFMGFTAAMDDAYIEMHRDAWSTIRPSPYRRDLHDLVTTMPQFDRSLVPIVAAPDGTLAAYCIGWYDPVSRWTEIEPLGTRPAYRGLGLARAVVREVIHRSWERGAQAVMVWSTDPRSTAHVNEPAWRLYTSSGMRPERVLREYRRAL